MIYHVKSGSLDCVVEAPDNTSAMDIAVLAIKQEVPESMAILTEVSGGQYCGDNVTYMLSTTVLERAGLLDTVYPTSRAKEISKEWFVDQGWTEEEADNLVSALEIDNDKYFYESMSNWANHVNEHKRFMKILELTAMGLITVSTGSNGKWIYTLKEGFRESPEGRRLTAEYGLASSRTN